MSNCKKINIGPVNGWEQFTPQAIIWTYDDPFVDT